MTPQQFISKWQRASLSERSACQQHFLDLCDLLGQPKPAEEDPEGTEYTFERGVTTTDGSHGWADVWKRGHFGWEYKQKHRDLDDAYAQLLRYREDLENPPLLVVCDLDRFRVHTNFTGTAKRVYEFDLAGLEKRANLDVLRKLFIDPDALRPGLTPETITENAAERFGQLADGMRLRGIAAPDAAHFLMKLMFCMFGEDVGLLPAKVFSTLLEGSKNDAARLATRLGKLFEAMTAGGDFGAIGIPWFNGGLFADAHTIQLEGDEIRVLLEVNAYDWANVEPSIFGTLFERTLDPAKRSQIGAHYTHKDDILTLLEPVMMAPLRREWESVKAQCEALWPKIQTAARKGGGRGRAVTPARSPAGKKFEKLLRDFAESLAHVTVLDPACGSGNFLYVAIKLLLDLNKEVISYAAQHSVSMYPAVRPTQLAGIEINPYAQELASVVIWIGYLQWMHDNGFSPQMTPVLEPIESIKRMDAILDLSDPEHPKEPSWSKADFVVGNPPFLGGRMIGASLGHTYVAGLAALYEQRLGGRPDICCYWFEKARHQIESGKAKRAGLLATQGIRGGTNRNVLSRIKNTGDIFFAESDRDWILDGATVHVSMIGFDGGVQKHRLLNGQCVSDIHTNLASGSDTTTAAALRENIGIAFQGSIKRGSFDIPESMAMRFLKNEANPHGKPNSDVILPYVNGLTIARRDQRTWIIDFGEVTSQNGAAMYSAPFEYLRATVLPERQKAAQQKAREQWWIHWCARPQMHTALAQRTRFIATPRVSKHRLFVWLDAPKHVDCQLVVFAHSDDYFFGIVQSTAHKVWSFAQGTQVRERESGFRYTPTTCFETFPFPQPTDSQRQAIADAAKELDRLRQEWLNPPTWTCTETLEFPGSVVGPWARYVHDTDGHGLGTVRYPRLVPKDEECAKQLAKRTLTSLYNDRPTWLDLAHRRLDEAVFDGYGWEGAPTDEEILARLLELNRRRGAAVGVTIE